MVVFASRVEATSERRREMATKTKTAKAKKTVKVRDMKPKKDAKAGLARRLR